MSRVTAYEATDGTLFKDKAAFRKHQAALNMVDGVTKIAGKFSDDADLNTKVAVFIVEHAEAIKAALEGKEVSVEAPAANEQFDDGADPIAA